MTNVWLRRDIQQRQADGEGSADAGVIYEAEEMCLTLPGTPTEEEVRERFDEFWEQGERSSQTLDDRVTAIENNLMAAALMS